MPVDALTRYSLSDGENGPPGGPEKAMLVDGVTINVDGACPVGFCAAAISVDNSIIAMHSKTIEASRPVTIQRTCTNEARGVLLSGAWHFQAGVISS